MTNSTSTVNTNSDSHPPLHHSHYCECDRTNDEVQSDDGVMLSCGRELVEPALNESSQLEYIILCDVIRRLSNVLYVEFCCFVVAFELLVKCVPELQLQTAVMVVFIAMSCESVYAPLLHILVDRLVTVVHVEGGDVSCDGSG